MQGCCTATHITKKEISERIPDKNIYPEVKWPELTIYPRGDTKEEFLWQYIFSLEEQLKFQQRARANFIVKIEELRKYIETAKEK